MVVPGSIPNMMRSSVNRLKFVLLCHYGNMVLQNYTIPKGYDQTNDPWAGFLFCSDTLAENSSPSSIQSAIVI